MGVALHALFSKQSTSPCSYFRNEGNYFCCIFVAAVQPGDYMMNSLTHTFTSSSPADSMACLNISIEDDLLPEGDETFIVSLVLLVTPQLPVTLGQTVVTIVDNEGQLDSISSSV